MQGELHGNVAYHGVELPFLASMLLLLAIPKSLLILRNFYTLGILVLLPTEYLRAPSA